MSAVKIAVGSCVRLCVSAEGEPMPRRTLSGIAIVEGVVIERVYRGRLARRYPVPHQPSSRMRLVVQCDGWVVLACRDDLVVVSP